MIQAHPYCRALIVIGAISYLYARCTRVLYESIIAIPSLGVQFETHRGTSLFTWSVKRTFVSLAELDDLILNEALYGWNVRYYMAALYRTEGREIRLHVAYENILPRYAVLRPVLHDLHQYLNVV
ncbi:unnamed protein product [Peniophora sp. CBMAI 1063]|nr:unnamed protein product [Peniophora sp. CBMAI 1063]